MSLADELRDIAKHGWRFNAATILENAAKKLDAHAEADRIRKKPIRLSGFFKDESLPPMPWRINIDRISPNTWRTEFKVGAQSFTIAQDDSDEAEAHCVHMGECLASALKAIGAPSGEIYSDRGSRPPIISDDNARARGVGPWGVWNETAGLWVCRTDSPGFAYGDRAEAESARVQLDLVSADTYDVRPFGGGSTWQERQWRKAVHAISSPTGLKAGELWDRLAEGMGLSRA